MDEQEMIETAFDDLIKSLRKGTTEESKIGRASCRERV